jgi:PEP-CTERM motif
MKLKRMPWQALLAIANEAPKEAFMVARLVVCAAVLMLPLSSVQAAPIAGKLEIGALTMTMDPGPTLNFFPFSEPQGNFDVTPGSTGDFAALIGTGGEIENFVVVPGPTSVPTFLTFIGAPALTFTLTSIDPGAFGSADCSASPAAGQTCTPPGGAGNWTNTSLTTGTASFVLHGTVSDGSGDPASAFTGVIDATFSGINFQEIFARLAAGETAVGVSGSGSFVVTPTPQAVPEPASLLLVGAGLLGVRLYRRKATCG